ncbi:MAG: hypothetical protein HY000_19050, partial [Planctomycetes bacterium]|nr:hypothetical protein [Planctomycetota bacterium]
YFDVRTEQFDYMILGPIGLQQVKPYVGGLELIQSYGDKSDRFAHYAEVYGITRVK